MRNTSSLFLLPLLLGGNYSISAQTGPFSPEDWPATKDPAKKVHYVSVGSAFTPVGADWLPDELQILSGGDQVTGPITIGGHDGVKVLGTYLNIADPMYSDWADDDTIDILVQAYGDAALFGANGNPR